MSRNPQVILTVVPLTTIYEDMSQTESDFTTPRIYALRGISTSPFVTREVHLLSVKE